jgi:hypothetical protein
MPDFGGVLWRWLYWNVVYCILSSNAVKNVTLVVYSFYSWADHMRLLLAWPSVSSLLNENWFLNIFFEFLIDLFYFIFCFCLWPQRRVLEDTILGWIPNQFVDGNRCWVVIDFFHKSLFWFSMFLNLKIKVVFTFFNKIFTSVFFFCEIPQVGALARILNIN